MRKLLSRFRNWLMFPVLERIRIESETSLEIIRGEFRLAERKNASPVAVVNHETLLVTLLAKCEFILQSIDQGTIAAIHKWINDSGASRLHLQQINRDMMTRWKENNDLMVSEINRLREENKYLQETIDKMFSPESEYI